MRNVVHRIWRRAWSIATSAFKSHDSSGVQGRRAFLGMLGAAPLVGPEIVKEVSSPSVAPLRGVSLSWKDAYTNEDDGSDDGSEASDDFSELVNQVRTRVRLMSRQVSYIDFAETDFVPYVNDYKSFAPWLIEKLRDDSLSRAKISSSLNHLGLIRTHNLVNRTTWALLKDFGWIPTHSVSYAVPRGYIKSIRSFSTDTKARLQAKDNARQIQRRDAWAERQQALANGLSVEKIAELLRSHQ